MEQLTSLRIVKSEQTDVYAWRYTLLVVHATKEEEEDTHGVVRHCTLATVSTSQGRMVRRSISSQDTWSLSCASWTTSRSTCTSVPQPTSVTSLPATTQGCLHHHLKGRALDIAPQVTNLRGAQGHGAHKAALHVPALYLPSYSRYSFTDPERMEG